MCPKPESSRGPFTLQDEAQPPEPHQSGQTMNFYFSVINPTIDNWDFLSFYLMSFFCSRTPFGVIDIYFSCLLRHPLAVTASQALLFSVILTVLRSAVFCRMCLPWDLSDGSLLIRSGLWVLGGRWQEKVPFLSASIQGTSIWLTAVGNPDHLAEAVFVSFLPCKLLFPIPSFLTALFGRKPQGAAHIPGEGVMFHLLEGKLSS